MDKLLQQLGIGKYSMYVMDYGAPTGLPPGADGIPSGCRRSSSRTETPTTKDCLQFWDPIKKYWNDATPENRAGLYFVVEPKATRWQYENGVNDLTLLDPTTWALDQIGLDRPGNRDIQMDLMYDYRTNVPLYPEFQAFFRQYQPPTLIVWGKNDFIFPPEGAAPYSRDLKNLETHLLDTGHFALETHGEEIASRIEGFLTKNKINASSWPVSFRKRDARGSNTMDCNIFTLKSRAGVFSLQQGVAVAAGCVAPGNCSRRRHSWCKMRSGKPPPRPLRCNHCGATLAFCWARVEISRSSLGLTESC